MASSRCRDGYLPCASASTSGFTSTELITSLAEGGGGGDGFRAGVGCWAIAADPIVNIATAIAEVKVRFISGLQCHRDRPNTRRPEGRPGSCSGLRSSPPFPEKQW